MLTVVEPVVAFAATFTVPVYVAFGFEHATLNGNAIALVTAGPPVTFLFTVNTPALALSGLTIVPLAAPPAAIAVALGCVYVGAAQGSLAGAVGGVPSVIVQLVEPAGMLTVVEPVVAFAATFTVPV